MRIGSGLSQAADARAAGIEAAMIAAEKLDERPDLAVVFASPHFVPHASSLVDAINEAIGPRGLIGCVAESIISDTNEIEDEPAVSVWAAQLSGGAPTFRAEFSGSSAQDATFTGWPEEEPGPFLLLCDPFTFPAHFLLERLNEKMPNSVIVGGLAGAAAGPGGARLFLDGDVFSSGAVGVHLPQSIEVHTLVSQGCRPVGQVFTVTRSEGNIIFELGGQPAAERVRELFTSLDPHERELVRRGLHVGRVIDEYQQDFGRGDFLIRPVMGADPESGAIAVGDTIPIGETIQFHVRDAASADEDLRETLAKAKTELGGRSPLGALLFTCNGRGSRLFSAPHHDAGMLGQQLGGPPTAGFFCAGELGPVGGKNWLHGFTASIALFLDH